jgi:integrase/recombinase XerD
MNLHAAIDSYVSVKRSLGAVFSAEARVLRSFGQAVGDMPVADVGREGCRIFCRGTGPPTRWWERKHYTLQAFFSFLVSRGYLAVSPLPDAVPKIPRSFEPHIYSRDELQRLLDATTVLQDQRSPLQHATFRTLLLVLYGAGLRPGEGLRLRCCDVNLSERTLAIWDTKFFKSRLVPIGSDLATALDSYHAARQRLSHSALFAS